jgi:mannose-6-phosphate isomerase-like protein (cupin superfamily)
MDIGHWKKAAPFTTADGSTIRELLSHRNSCLRNQSLAEATLPPGGRTREHYHPQAEEIYVILRGSGRVRVGEEERDVGPWDAVAIPPGVRHVIWNMGEGELVFLCCCAPGYEHADTVLVEP